MRDLNNRWNGFGGKVEDADVTIEAAAARELEEECGLTAVALIPIGLLFTTRITIGTKGSQGELEEAQITVFMADAYTGTLVETEEMHPCWFGLDNLPKEMHQEFALYLPRMVQGRAFDLAVRYVGDAMHVASFV